MYDVVQRKGVLEFLRNTEVVGPKGKRTRLLDSVSIITGVSGGSFTALAYGLHGDKLFDDYEQRFLKRNVQTEIVSRTLNRSPGRPFGRAEGGALNRWPIYMMKSVQRRYVWRSQSRERPVNYPLGHRHFHRH